MAVLDTNVLIRHLTRDHADHSARALQFLLQVESGAIDVFLPESVVAEVVFVLSSKNYYNVSRDDIQDRLGDILRLRGIRMDNRQVSLRALDLYVQHRQLKFVDCLCAAHAEFSSDPTVYTFDKDFRRIDDVTWIEP